MKQNISMEEIVSLCKRRGFIFQHDEIYGGLGSVWDYGPYGSLMKEKIRRAFIDEFVTRRSDVYLLESANLTRPEVFSASGHVDNFSDPLVECKSCHKRFRSDEKIEDDSDHRHELTDPKNFNLMFSTQLGSTTDSKEIAYLRPETAQGMFTNFSNVLDSTRTKLPFGIAQVGRSFRNEITTGNFNFRAREFEIGEIEYFVKPPRLGSEQAGDDEKWFLEWISIWEQFIYKLGIKEGSLHHFEHPKEKLAHYSKGTIDLEYDYPFGRSELAGIANRTDFDLKAHQEKSGVSMEYFDSETGEKFIPYVIEPTIGIDRLFLALLCDAIQVFPQGRKNFQMQNEEFRSQNLVQNSKSGNSVENDQQEIVLHLDPKIAPIQVAVLPLSKKAELTEPAKKIAQDLRRQFSVEYDETGSIGKRYRRQDEIGTPLCVTFDFSSITDNMVTIRNRDTMEQDRIAISELSNFIQKELENWG